MIWLLTFKAWLSFSINPLTGFSFGHFGNFWPVGHSRVVLSGWLRGGGEVATVSEKGASCQRRLQHPPTIRAPAQHQNNATGPIGQQQNNNIKTMHHRETITITITNILFSILRRFEHRHSIKTMHRCCWSAAKQCTVGSKTITSTYTTKIVQHPTNNNNNKSRKQ